MFNLETIIIVNIVFSLGLSLIYFYLHSQYGDKYMGIWALSWLFFSIRIGLDLSRFLGYSSSILLLLNQIITISSVVMLLWGMYSFIGIRLPRWWIYCALFATILTDLGVGLGISLKASSVPTAVYFGAAEIWTGFMMLRFWGVQGIGKQITGYVLVVIGLLNLSYPYISTGVSRFGTTVFFMAATVLWMVVITGILLVYFEKVRHELKVSEQRFRTLVENSQDIIYRFSFKENGCFDYISPSFYTITGYNPDQLYSSPELIFDLVDKDYHSSIKDAWEKRNLHNQSLIFLIHSRTGKDIWVEKHSVPIFDEVGNLVAIEGIVRDISYRKKVEKEITRLEQLRILGQTAAGIAHEIRNPMTTVRGFLQLLMRKADIERYREFMELMITELDRANFIITDFLSLSKEKRAVMKQQNLNDIILTLKPLLETNAFVSSKRIEFNLSEIRDLLLDETEIKQMILNIVQNGLEAMAPDGLLEISTSLGETGVVLEVKDQGTGFEPTVLDKLGEPFITTKEKGTGLGLAICYSIAHRHSAKIYIDTNQYGTKVGIEFVEESMENTNQYTHL